MLINGAAKLNIITRKRRWFSLRLESLQSNFTPWPAKRKSIEEKINMHLNYSHSGKNSLYTLLYISLFYTHFVCLLICIMIDNEGKNIIPYATIFRQTLLQGTISLFWIIIFWWENFLLKIRKISLKKAIKNFPKFIKVI